MRIGTWIAAMGSVIALGGSAAAAPPDVRDTSITATFGPQVRIVRDSLSGGLRALYGLAVPTVGATSLERAQHFIATQAALLQLGVTALVPVAAQTVPYADVVRFRQTALGIPVEGRSLAVKLDGAGKVTSVTSDLVPFELVRPALTISPEAAREAVKSRFEVALTGTPSEVVLVSAPHLARLAWRVAVAVIPLQAHFIVWVDAETGAILRQAPAGLDQPLTRLPEKAHEHHGGQR